MPVVRDLTHAEALMSIQLDGSEKCMAKYRNPVKNMVGVI